ncbi:12986_t:CDS:2, partial [Acaulospora colombiana]
TMEKWRYEGFSRASFYLDEDIHHISSWLVPIDLLKSFGSLANILAMIEEGDQGSPLRERVQAIRDDDGFMQCLELEWTKKRRMNHGFSTYEEDEDDDWIDWGLGWELVQCHEAKRAGEEDGLTNFNPSMWEIGGLMEMIAAAVWRASSEMNDGDESKSMGYPLGVTSSTRPNASSTSPGRLPSKDKWMSRPGFSYDMGGGRTQAPEWYPEALARGSPPEIIRPKSA